MLSVHHAEEKEKTSLHTRLQAVYRKAVVRMRFFAEVWYVTNEFICCDDSSLSKVYVVRVESELE